MQINRSIERFLREHDLPPTKFGRLAVRDPRLVPDMRNGRQMRDGTRARIEDFMQRYSKANR